MNCYDVVVVGGGPAGLTAALYAARGGRRVLLLEQESFGGQIVTAPRVENYPGLPGCSGAAFADGLVAQVLALGVEIELDRATGLDRREDIFHVMTGGGLHRGRTVILATGVTHRGLGLPNEADLIGAGISFCAVCDGAFFHGRPVAVIGGGDTALQDALFLSAGCDHVTLIHRRDQFRGEAHLVTQLQQRENVTFLLSHIPEGYEQVGGQLRGLRLRNLKDHSISNLAVEGVFLAVGQSPDNTPFVPWVALDQWGYAAVGEDCTTHTPGLFLAGDCRGKTVRQLTTAVGDGAVAAMAACTYLDRG